MALNSTTNVSPDVLCLTQALQASFPFLEDSSNCSITPNLLSLLHLVTFNDYFGAYCAKPPDDSCPYGFCPNFDIAGPLTRIAAYLTNFHVAILVFYNPEEVKEAFWAQTLTVYSLLLTCAITIFQAQLTRIHAILTVTIAGSPLSLYIVIYAVRSIFGGNHRLASVVGHRKQIPRTVVLVALAVWTGLVIYIVFPAHLSHFSQPSCERSPVFYPDGPSGDPAFVQSVVQYFLFMPVVFFLGLAQVSKLGAAMVTMPIDLVITAWVIAILRRRREIWPRGKGYSPRFRTVWHTVRDNYPFLQFVSIVLLPFIYWAASIEFIVFETSPGDETFSATFGQILGTFVAVQPMISVAKLSPQLIPWFRDLAWVRLLTGQPRRRKNATAMYNSLSLIETNSTVGYEKGSLEIPR